MSEQPQFIEVTTENGERSMAIALSQIARIERNYGSATTHVVLVSGEDYVVEESYRTLCARMGVPDNG